MASPIRASKILPMIDCAISAEKTTGAFCGLHLACAEALQRATGCDAPDLFGTSSFVTVRAFENQ